MSTSSTSISSTLSVSLPRLLLAWERPSSRRSRRERQDLVSILRELSVEAGWIS